MELSWTVHIPPDFSPTFDPQAWPVSPQQSLRLGSQPPVSPRTASPLEIRLRGGNLGVPSGNLT